MKKVESPNNLNIFFKGPPLEEGPLPAFFYFALSAGDSLETDPYNQPVKLLQKNLCRIFSVTLPGHENNHSPQKAINIWVEKMSKGEEVIPNFIQKLKEAIDYLSPNFRNGKLAVIGLSRGAFIACHIAAVCPQISHILGYAPLTKLSILKEYKFSNNSFLDLENLASKIYNRKLRFYIGNCDTRVGVEHAFSMIHKLSKAANERKISSPSIELIISPSIGYKGHGTSPETFKNGIEFLKKEVNI